MRWSEIIAEVTALSVWPAADPEVASIEYDSRRVQPGSLFVAMRGGTVDGNNFVDAALALGAIGIITDDPNSAADVEARRVPCALVEHGRRALAEASAVFFSHPERKLKVSAVTGTNGKTTTAFLLEQLLTSAGRKCLLIGTIETRIAGRVLPSEHTTPEARDLYALFAEAVAAGCTEVVMEMSSHALAQERVWGIPVDVAIFTNLTQDHLDFHGTMRDYFEAKTKLFTGVGTPAPRVAVINIDDALGVELAAHTRFSHLTSYGLAADRTMTAKDVKLNAGVTHFEWVTRDFTAAVATSLSGRVNVYNWLAAAGAALARGLTRDEILRGTQQLRQVPGRFEVVKDSTASGFTVVVDYAHTDDALKNLIELARELVAAHNGRVITLFGCGGDRDRTKRLKMGRVAGALSDEVVLTSDNPRSEDPLAIIDQILPGLCETRTPAHIEPDRRKAIALAISLAKPGDIVLLAGKGHEKTQTFASGPVPFDDVEEAAQALREARK